MTLLELEKKASVKHLSLGNLAVYGFGEFIIRVTKQL